MLKPAYWFGWAAPFLALGLYAQELPGLRLRVVREVEGKTHTVHGTAFVLDEYVLTAAHNVTGPGVVAVESRGAWITCAVVKTDSDFDVAFLKPHRQPAAPKPLSPGFVCYAAARGEPVRELFGEPLGSASAHLPEFDLGGSGAPVFQAGRLVGMVVAKFEALPGKVKLVPLFVLKALKP